jgi:hypothetical protein
MAARKTSKKTAKKTSKKKTVKRAVGKTSRRAVRKAQKVTGSKGESMKRSAVKAAPSKKSREFSSISLDNRQRPVAHAPVHKTNSVRMKRRGVSRGVGILGLILNLLLLPGLGTLICKRTKAGVWQIVLAVVGGLLFPIIIGIPMVIAAWVWALISSVRILQNAH